MQANHHYMTWFWYNSEVCMIFLHILTIPCVSSLLTHKGGKEWEEEHTEAVTDVTQGRSMRGRHRRIFTWWLWNMKRDEKVSCPSLVAQKAACYGFFAAELSGGQHDNNWIQFYEKRTEIIIYCLVPSLFNERGLGTRLDHHLTIGYQN